MRGIILLAAVLGALAVQSKPALAYLDPGTGSMMVQLLLGAVAGGLVAGKLYWMKIKQFFQRKSVGQPQIEPDPDDG